MVIPIENSKTLSTINIKAVGIGNAGGNILSRIYNKINGVQFVIFNTDAFALQNAKGDIKIQIGEKTTKGTGTGKDPEKGRFAASEDKEKIAEALKNTQILFLVAGLGGGTGTGGAPVIAKIAKDLGAIVISLVTTPFDLEGEKIKQYANEGLEILLKNVDTLIHISNQKLYEIVEDKTSCEKAFEKIDEIIMNTISSLSDLIYKPKLLDIDLANICSVVENAGRGIVGIGSGKGEGRIEQAVKSTIENPLIEKSEIMEAKNILISIIGSPDLTLKEFREGVSLIQSRISSPSTFLGLATDPNLTDEVKITLLATGIGKSPTPVEKPYTPYPSKPKKSEELPLDKEIIEEIIDEPIWKSREKGEEI
ncbi:MAG: cell division protein FtsZ [bacterium]|nr:cell division protein FtsZ [bacterium]MCX7917379.1 cell division protein FtsZ [bacterium]MDW8163307.1 cell division protein FtsZ [Candidatus Omnitrophota bacterium]